jgi:hypothetical protein
LWDRTYIIRDIYISDIQYIFLEKYFIIENPNTKAHFFVIVEDENIENNEVKMMDCKMTLFKTNLELFKLIIKYEAFSENYQRHFRINKILKQ